MKRRIRTLVRAGWHLVEVKPSPSSDSKKEYLSYVNWCISNVPENEWHSSWDIRGGFHSPGVKRFVFKDEKYVTWFNLITEAK